MKKFNKNVTIALFSLLVWLVGIAPGSAISQTRVEEEHAVQRPAEWRHGHGRGPARGHHAMRMREELNLTDEQAEKIREISTLTRKTAIKTRADLRIARIELRELMRPDKVDRDQLDAKISEIGRLRQELLRLRIHTRLQIREVLTPEQRERARSLPRGRFRGGHGRRG